MTGVTWRPVASPEQLWQRARVLRQVRAFFWQRGVLEVETPHWLPCVAPELHQEPVACHTGHLHTSPETCMKRMVAAGSGPIYQICRVFRADEQGTLHAPEFTMLEWYRPGWSYRALMEEVETLLWTVLALLPESRWAQGGRARQWSYAAAFREFAGLDPFDASLEQLRDACRERAVSGDLCGESADLTAAAWDRQTALDLLLVQRVEPALRAWGGAAFLVDFPPAAAAMARLAPGPPPVAERFELYLAGVELANGYQELTDPVEQRRRLESANRQRCRMGKRPLPMDERFLQALEHGLPESAGVALGLDRLIMLALGARRIQDVMAFPFEHL
ncbi:MAG: EF-P lysine aminoacylase EpmA [Magnetococcus sp. MYC-9]